MITPEEFLENKGWHKDAKIVGGALWRGMVDMLKEYTELVKESANVIPRYPGCFCPKEGLVIDPFCGGGNIPKVAKCEGVNFIAGDLDEYCVNYTKDKLNECGGLF